MAFAARRSLASRLSHHLNRRLHPSIPHLLTSHSHDEPPNPSPPPPLPPFRSPLPHTSRTLGFLPFSLHLAGPSRRGFSSSAPATDAAPSGEVDAAAGVLVDAAEAAAASVPAPFPGEVAAAAADSFFPVAALQHVIDSVHTFTGLNWWACIALTTVLIRSATIPLLLNQLRATAKLNAIRPEMEAIKEGTNTMDPKSALEGKDKMTSLFKKHGVSPFTPLKGLLIQGPIFMSFFFAISNMVEKVPSLKGGGAFWFTDLTTPDALYIFPVLAGLTFLATVELNLQEGVEGNPMAGKMKNFSRGMAVMTVPFTMNFAKAIFFYWITSNMFSLVYGIVIRRPAVRKYFNLPSLVAQPASAQKPTFSLFGGSKAVPAAESPLAVMGAQRSTLEQPDAAALGYRVKNLEKKVKSRGKSRRRRIAGAAMLASVVNYWWPGFSAELAAQEYGRQENGDQCALRVSHHAPGILHWWMEQSWLPTSTVVNNTNYLPNKRNAEICRTRTADGTLQKKQPKMATQQGIHRSYYWDMTVMFSEWEFDMMGLLEPLCPVHAPLAGRRGRPRAGRATAARRWEAQMG